MNKYNFIDFMKNSTTCFQACEEIEKILLENNFKNIDNETIKLSGSYYKKRDDGAIIAFKIPDKKPSKFYIVGSHCDSPCYKLKTQPHIYKDNMTYLNVAPYGGMLHSTFMDIPLGIAGRVCYIENNEVKSKLIDFKKPMCIMANLAIHYNRKANQGYILTPGKDLVPFLSNEKIDLFNVIKDNFNIKGDIVSHDLYIYSAVTPYIWGLDNEFITSPRLDDLQCAYSSTMAIINSKPKEIAISCVFNNEEIGSMTYNGADSNFLETVITKISKDLNITDLFDMYENSFLLSADNAHGLNANYLEFYDSVNKAYLNKGIVIKFNANQKYTTTALSAAKVINLCKKNNIPYQILENHSNVSGGATLGNILTSQLSIPAADIGLAQYAMHSAVETAGFRDIKYLTDMLTNYFEEV